MSEASARLLLPYLAPSQAQKHVTHNEALQILDLLVQPTVQGLDANTPPTDPEDGQIWALGGAPTGVWTDHADEMAAWVNGAWLFLIPQEGWQVLDVSDGNLWHRMGASWARLAATETDNLDGIGINTTYDLTNRLSVASANTLLTHEGAGHQLKINKAGATDTASLLFQTGFSGRAEMGTAGSDDFTIKVSPDGINWTTGISVDTVTGLLSGAAITQSSTDSTSGRVLKVGDFGVGSRNLPAITDINVNLTPCGSYETNGSTAGTMAPGNPTGILTHLTLDPQTSTQTWQSVLSNTRYQRRYRAGVWSAWFKIYDTGNTTVDANGFVKAASPILRLLVDQTQEPVEPVGATFSRISVGHYLLSDVEPLATEGWSIEIPQDANGNRLVFAQTDYDPEARTLTVKTAEVDWDGRWCAGAPKDIPEGRWIDLRFADPDTEED